MPSVFNREKFLKDNPGRLDYADDPALQERLRNTHPHYFTEEPTSTSSSTTPTPMSNKRISSSLNEATPQKTIKTTADSTNNIATTDIQDAMGLTGTGAEQASGGASSDGQARYVSDVPRTLFGDRITVYKKCHKFMTFAIPAVVLTGDATSNPNEFYMSSHLAEVPWELPVLYMNPSEFALLPPGSHAVKMMVECVYRGATIQFQTNQTTTSLATLNQINDISCSIGLNKTGWGSNAYYSGFNTIEPMIPTACTRPIYASGTPANYRGLIALYYGQNNNSTNFSSHVPHHQVSTQTFLYNYWITTTRGGTTASNNAMWGGWPNIGSKYTQYDGKTVVNQQILSAEYTPKMGPLKDPLKYYKMGLPKPDNQVASTITTNVNGNLVAGRKSTVSLLANNSSDTPSLPGTNTETQAEFVNPTFAYDIYTPIEKSQTMRTGLWGEGDAHIQPSVHIGVNPVPSLTTTTSMTDGSGDGAWTDCRAYWEVTATMIVKSTQPTEFPFATNANVPLGDAVLCSDNTAARYLAYNRGAPLAGLYTDTPFTPNGTN